MKNVVHWSPILVSSLFLVRGNAFSPARATTLGFHIKVAPSHLSADLDANCQYRHSPLSSLAILRGGAILPISKTTVAKVCTGFLAFNGVALLLSPIQFIKKQYKITDVEKNSVETYFLRAIGAISIGVSINVYLSLIDNMTAQKAMGFALLPRFLYVLKSSLLGKDLEKLGGSNKFLSTNEIVMGWTTFSLLTGAGNPTLSAKIFSCMAMLKGLFFVAKPEMAAYKFLGLDVSKLGT
jgi:hypothetical protein